MSGSPEAARDLVQEAFLRAARSIQSVPAGESSEGAWLVRVLINICRDQWRHEARVRRHQAVATPPVGSTAHPEAALIAHDTVWRALRCLPPRRRAAVVMFELEGIEMREIAKLLGVTAVTARWHVSRGRHELAKAIRDGRMD